MILIGENMDSFVNKYKNAIEAFNFDDFILLPGFAKTEPKDVELKTKFSKSININIPVVSSPMDTVTESAMAIAMAKFGGIGVIHRNCSAKDEVRMVRLVKEESFSKETYRDAVVDEKGNLMVAAAVSPFDIERANELSKYADALLIDVAHFHNPNIINSVKKIIDATSVDVVIGSFGTKQGVVDCVSKLDNAAALRVGIGSGSICTTTDVTRAGSPTLFAVANAADALQEIGSNIPIIADGGIRTSGDIALASVFGASSSMLGYILAGCKESPSEIATINNKSYKIHRGMGSRQAREKRAALDRYGNLGGKNLEEGVEMLIPYTGEAENVLDKLTSGIKASIGYSGSSDISGMKNTRIAKIDTRNQKIESKLIDRGALLH
jgi:IMP dehydrogenase/GMP reductase